MDAAVIKDWFIQYLPTIINYVLMLVAYILVFIFKLKVGKTRDSMTVLYKDNREKLEAKADKLNKEWLEKMVEAKADYEKAREELNNVRAAYEARITTLENIIEAYISEGDKNGTEK